MKAGRRDRRISLLQRTVTRTATGDPVESWAFRALLWAEWSPQAVLERFAADQRYASVEVVFRIGFSAFGQIVSPSDHRVSYRGREYEILGTQEIGRREGLYVVCSGRSEDATGN